MGSDGFFWWHGVVEDVLDPLQLGRVRVRVFGYHSESLLQLPVEDLPWSYPMQSITSAALSGIGSSPTGLLVGSHVFGFFRDGSEAQDPVVIGSFAGIPKQSPTTPSGFYDPSGRYPVPKFLEGNVKYPVGVSLVEEVDTNRLIRNDGSITVQQLKKAGVKKDINSIPDMKGKHKWSEPATPYAAIYPKNHVRFTEQGNIEEYDDTIGAERIHVYHCSGTFSETGNGWVSDPDGTRVQKIVGNDYEICLANKKIFIAGADGLDIVINGSANVTIGGAANIQINGDANILAKSNINIQCDGDMKLSSGKKMEFYSAEEIAFSGKAVSFKSDGGGVMTMQGGKINLNSGPAVTSPKIVSVQ